MIGPLVLSGLADPAQKCDWVLGSMSEGLLPEWVTAAAEERHLSLIQECQEAP